MFGWLNVKKEVTLDSLIEKGVIIVDFEKGLIKTNKHFILLQTKYNRNFAADVRMMQNRMNEIVEKKIKITEVLSSTGKLHQMILKHGPQIETALQRRWDELLSMQQGEQFVVRKQVAETLIYKYWDEIKHRFPSDVVLDMEKYHRHQLV